MLKKVLLGTLVAGGVGVLFVGTPLAYYARTAYSTVRDTVKESVPIQIEIKRARQMIEELKPEIASNLRIIAQQEVEVARLTSEVENKQDQLAVARDKIMRLKTDLSEGKEQFVYAGRKFTSTEVKQDLNNRFEQFKTQESVTDKMEKDLGRPPTKLGSCSRKTQRNVGSQEAIGNRS
jgi:chromosome segregation ATPase